MLIIHHIILILLWIAFGVLHSMLAAPWWKQKMQRWMGANFKYYHFAYSVFAEVSMISILIYQFTMESRLLFTVPVWGRVLVGLPLLTGLTIMLMAIRKYFFSLSGISVFYKRQPPVELEQSGMHRYVRHPLYAGTLLFIWSLFILFPYLNYLLAGIIITAYTLLGARIEEKKLVERFGEKYVRYKQNVPMIVPKFGK